MNANELADELKTLDHDDWYEWITEAATMLRQQQDEIEELIKHLEFAGIVVERKAQEK